LESNVTKKISVYIIEDDDLSSEHLKIHLLDRGYEISGCAASAEAAILAIEELQPSIVFVDIVLSGKMDGIEAASIIEDRFRLPIIYLTAHHDRRFFERAKLTTPCAYLLKPFNEAELELTIDMAIYRHNIIMRMLRATETAEAISLQKTNFIAYLNHELRTPLNSMLGYGQLIMMDHDSLTPDHQEDLKEMLLAGKHMMKLINETLDLSLIESGKINIWMENINLNEVIHECLAIIQSLANINNVKIVDHIPENSGYVIMGDITRVKEVLLNILSNAIKYNRPKGLVTIDCSTQETGKLRLTITDTGIGIKKDEISKLFQPFERLNTENSPIKGTGIGLTISQRLMRMMGGEIGYEHNPEGGSIFWTEFQQYLAN
jgi:signal transduction histidine kinase